MVEQYEKVTLEDNEDISLESYNRAQKFGVSLREIYSALPQSRIDHPAKGRAATPPEEWKHNNNQPVYTEKTQENVFSSSYDFVNRLRWNQTFTGYSLANVFDPNKKRSWTDPIAKEFSNADLEGVPDWSVLEFRRLISGLPEALICRPPPLFGEVGWLVEGSIVNRDTIAYQERLKIMQEFGLIDWLRNKEAQGPVRVIEIGGGYGGLGYFLGQIFDNIHYVNCDLTVSLFFSATYLSEVVGHDKVVIYDGNNPEILMQGSEARYVCLPNHFFDHLLGQTFDIAINTMSFIEMPVSVVDHYAQGLKSLLMPEGILFEQNYFFLPPDAPPTWSEPRAIIQKYFKYKLGMDRKSYWGIPNLWFNHIPVELLTASKIPFHKS